MKFEIYGEGNNLKVAFFNVPAEKDSFWVHAIRTLSQSIDIEIHNFEGNPKLSLDKILKYISHNKIIIGIFFGTGEDWPEFFLKKFKKIAYPACYFADDPEGSERVSRPYVKYYLYAFCGGVFFDQHTRIEAMYRRWGAIKSKFIPIGVYPGKYIKGFFNNFDKRTIDLIYVGGCYFPKVLRIFRLKSHFGQRMRFYGRGWNKSNSLLKTMILKILKILFRIPYIEELPKDELVELYQNTKVGFNTHMSYGPSNVRTYELPANGVMEISDCENGLNELFVIDRDLVCYKTVGEAIKKIEFYLKNEQARNEIAANGYNKVITNYTFEKSMETMIREILVDMVENYSDQYPISLETKKLWKVTR